ncbi:MAG TPA: nicotinate-nucleotide adenylyltransferase [Solirubrobacteraceae bacterium]|nr:nicotinate-nucleotide adenylyltransferase [Solirubrobacteraceae bacterium]
MRLGLLGGTFNPPHLGHLVCAQEAWAQLRLDRVLLLPVATPPHKRSEADPGPRERLELCRLAAGDDERLGVCSLEIERGGASYTVDTLRVLHDRSPQDELTFIVGGDMALSLPTWREPEAVLGLATLAVAERSGAGRQDISDRLTSLGAADRVAFFDMPRLDISSSAVRGRVADGRPVRYLVPGAVAERIEARGLYRPHDQVGNPNA